MQFMKNSVAMLNYMDADNFDAAHALLSSTAKGRMSVAELEAKWAEAVSTYGEFVGVSKMSGNTYDEPVQDFTGDVMLSVTLLRCSFKNDSDSSPRRVFAMNLNESGEIISISFPQEIAAAQPRIDSGELAPNE